KLAARAPRDRFLLDAEPANRRVVEIAQELGYGLVRLGVSAHQREELRWNRDDICARQNGFVDIDHLPDAADDDFRRDSLLARNRSDLANPRPSVIADVADATPEQTHEIRAGVSCNDCLVQ